MNACMLYPGYLTTKCCNINMINSMASVSVVGTQHLSYLFAYNLDSYNCQHISGSPQLSIGLRTDNQALIDHGRIALRHQKFNDWFFRQFDLDLLDADGQHYHWSTIIVNNLNQAIKIFFQLNTSSEGANIISSPFYPREGTRCAEKVFGGSRNKIWEQHKQHWNRASPERIRYGHQDTVKALNRILKAMTISPVKKSKCLGSVSPVREPPRTKTSRQQTAVAVTIRPQVLINKVNVATIPKGRNQSHTNQKSAVAQKEQKINIMSYVEVKNFRIYRKLVSSHPNYQLELTKILSRYRGRRLPRFRGSVE